MSHRHNVRNKERARARRAHQADVRARLRRDAIPVRARVAGVDLLDPVDVAELAELARREPPR